MKPKALLYGILAGLLFGIATPLSKLLISDLNSFHLSGLLYLGAAITFIPYILIHHKRELKELFQRERIKYILGIILFGGILGPLFLMLGLKSAKSMSVSIWLNMELVATALLGILLFKEHIDRFSLFGIIITLIAGIVTSLGEPISGAISGIFVLLACLFWGIDNHLTAIIDNVSPQTTTFIKGIFGGFTNFIIGMFISNWNIEFKLIPLSLVIGIFSYGLSIVLYISSAQEIGATRSQILFSTAPFWGIFTAFLILGEPFGLIIIIAFSLLLIGIVLTNISYHEHTHFHDEILHIHEHTHDDAHHDHEHPEINEKNYKHSHKHHHSKKKHTHKHYPDLHHRHDH